MAVYDYPDTLTPQRMEWRSIKAGVQSRSPISGFADTTEFPAERFVWMLTLPDRRLAEAGEPQAYFGRISGGIDRVRMRHFKQPAPRGTMRGAPTLHASVARGAQALQIATAGTLKAGDLFKIAGQVFMVFQDCAPVAGVLTVPLVHRVRAALAAGTAVVWDRPTFLAIIPAPSSSISMSPGKAAGMTVELVEVFA
ncbi:hypothetical protein [Roseateles cavernae]|uniref:hypothetical protein n=1 Tax=Roseateles cavernae TaxID=3153578 RepID=UPI0032E40380